MACGDPRQARRARLRSAASVQSGACAYRRGLSVATTHSRRFCGQMSLVRITANCRRARRNVAIPPRRAAAASASKAIFRRTCPVFVPSSIEPKHNPRLWVSVAWVQTNLRKAWLRARGAHGGPAAADAHGQHELRRNRPPVTRVLAVPAHSLATRAKTPREVVSRNRGHLWRVARPATGRVPATGQAPGTLIRGRRWQHMPRPQHEPGNRFRR
jgi:hypothetical protein